MKMVANIHFYFMLVCAVAALVLLAMGIFPPGFFEWLGGPGTSHSSAGRFVGFLFAVPAVISGEIFSWIIRKEDEIAKLGEPERRRKRALYIGGVCLVWILLIAAMVAGFKLESLLDAWLDAWMKS